MNKYFLYFGLLTLLSGCYQSTASLSFMGPALTVGTSGNVYQAGVSYGSNYLIKEATGKTTSEHLFHFIESKYYKNTKEKITNVKKELEESKKNFEESSMDFYASVKNFYLKEKE